MLTRVLLPHRIKQHSGYERAWEGVQCSASKNTYFPWQLRGWEIRGEAWWTECLLTHSSQQREGFLGFPGTVEPQSKFQPRGHVLPTSFQRTLQCAIHMKDLPVWEDQGRNPVAESLTGIFDIWDPASGSFQKYKRKKRKFPETLVQCLSEWQGSQIRALRECVEVRRVAPGSEFWACLWV